jgi:hypothetical protein
MSLSTSWPSVTADPLKFNSKQFVNDLAYAVGQDNFDGVIKNDPIDFPSYPTDPSSFANTGDPRHPMDVAMKAMFDEFLPRQQAYQEAASMGGCKIINSYICDADGVPIAKATTNCDPNINIEVIKPQEVIDFVNINYQNAIKAESDAFIDYIKTTYVNGGWTIHLYDFSFIKHFFVKITKLHSQNIFFKYFYDQKDYVSDQLGIPLVQLDVGANILDSADNPAEFIKMVANLPPIYNQPTP